MALCLIAYLVYALNPFWLTTDVSRCLSTPHPPPFPFFPFPKPPSHTSPYCRQLRNYWLSYFVVQVLWGFVSVLLVLDWKSASFSNEGLEKAPTYSMMQVWLKWRQTPAYNMIQVWLKWRTSQTYEYKIEWSGDRHPHTTWHKSDWSGEPHRHTSTKLNEVETDIRTQRGTSQIEVENPTDIQGQNWMKWRQTSAYNVIQDWMKRRLVCF